MDRNFCSLFLLLTVCAAWSFQIRSSSATLRTPQHSLIRRHGTEIDLQEKRLSGLEYYVIRLKGTEPAWSSSLNYEKREGEYRCKACGTPLFDAKTKFESGTGWPSFYDAYESVSKKRDVSGGLVFVLTAIIILPSIILHSPPPSLLSLLVFAVCLALIGVRTEIVCQNCNGHLGHVFPDGPRETTSLRYCCNGAALTFEPSPSNASVVCS
mmetsp:Transcript_8031/g.11204  ORF Transcript_8031/g.11204 Transcript_8031/m.11204 type:complete len:211 (+) Transcript_8031:94-726(+)